MQLESKCAFNNWLQQSAYLCDKRNMSQIWQVNTIWQSQGYRSHHDVAHLQTPTNVSTKYLLPIFYGC